jgi:hypothetical protein
MPIYSVYDKIIKIGKKKGHKVQNTVIYTFYESPFSWSDLKDVLLIASRHAYFDYQQDINEISIQRHLPGRYLRGTTSYRESRIRYKRQDEFRAQITYLPLLNEVKIEKATFITPEFYNFKADYDSEKHTKWHPAKIVPAGFEAQLNNPDPALLYMQNLNIKTTSYLVDPHNRYDTMQHKRKETGSYSGIARGSYAPRNYSTVERDASKKQGQV